MQAVHRVACLQSSTRRRCILAKTSPTPREFTNADAAKLDLERCALDHGYDVKSKATVVTCTRAGQPEVNVVDKDGGPGRRPFKTGCQFKCVLKKSRAGVKVVVVNGEHNHPIDLDIGVKYWSGLTEREKERVNELKDDDESLTVPQVKEVINREGAAPAASSSP